MKTLNELKELREWATKHKEIVYYYFCGCGNNDFVYEEKYEKFWKCGSCNNTLFCLEIRPN